MVAQTRVAEEGRELPPGERAFEVYRLIEVDGLSTRAVAQQVGLSQTRVVQLRDAVESWVARRPSATAALTKEQRLRAAEYKAGLRLDRLYSLAIEAFRASQGAEVTSEESFSGGQTVKTRITQGNTRYLAMALRIAAVQSRIPATPGVLAGDETACEALDVEELGGASPPVGDCSLAAAEQAESDEVWAAGEAVNSCSEVASDSASEDRRDASERLSDEFCPVQIAVQRDRTEPLVQRPLTKKERKRRARLLASLRTS